MPTRSRARAQRPLLASGSCRAPRRAPPRPRRAPRASAAPAPAAGAEAARAALRRVGERTGCGARGGSKDRAEALAAVVALEEGEREARLLIVVERRGIVAETIVDLGPEDRLAKAEYALDGAQPVILAASVSYVDDESFVIPSGVATEPSGALPPHEAHPLPAHRTPFPKPLM